jgi:putative acetyltransferase
MSLPEPEFAQLSGGTPDRLLGLVVGVDDPHRADVRALLEAHLRFCFSSTPLCHAYALDAERLAHPDVTFFSAREHGVVIGVGAVKRIDARHAELKSMHTAEAARGRGIGRALLEDLLSFARGEGYQRVSLETGTMEGFAAARRLYERAGFVPCGPFGDYTTSPDNTFMTMELA